MIIQKRVHGLGIHDNVPNRNRREVCVFLLTLLDGLGWTVRIHGDHTPARDQLLHPVLPIPAQGALCSVGKTGGALIAHLVCSTRIVDVCTLLHAPIANAD